MNKLTKTQRLKRQNQFRLSAILEKPSKAFMNKQIKWGDRDNRFTNKVQKPKSKKVPRSIEGTSYYQTVSSANLEVNLMSTQYRPTRNQSPFVMNTNPRQVTSRSKSKKKLGLTNTTRSLHYTHHHQESQMYDLFQSLISKVFTNNDGCECPEGCRRGRSLILWGEQYKNYVNNNIYSKLKSTEPEINNKIQIQKDISRTQPHINSFKTKKYLSMLQNILKVYSLCDKQVGYVQGMNIILSGLLYHIKEQQPTFWVFARLMKQKGIRQLFIRDFQLVYYHLKNINKLIQLWINDLYLHFFDKQILIQQVCFSWVLTLMSVLINVDYMHIVHEGFIYEDWNYIYKLIISYLLYHKEILINQQDTSTILTYLSVGYGQNNTRWKQVFGLVKTLKFNN